MEITPLGIVGIVLFAVFGKNFKNSLLCAKFCVCRIFGVICEYTQDEASLVVPRPLSMDALGPAMRLLTVQAASDLFVTRE